MVRGAWLWLGLVWLAGCNLVLPLSGRPGDASPQGDSWSSAEAPPLPDGPLPVDGPTALGCQQLVLAEGPGALRGVWGGWPASPDVIAVGDGGRILHYNPDALTVAELGSGSSIILGLEDVWFTSLSDVRMAGGDQLDNRRYLHWDGAVLTPVSLAGATDPGTMRGIACGGNGDCYMVGTGRRFFYLFSPPLGWVSDNLAATPPAADLNGVAVTSDGLAVAVGNGGVVTVVAYDRDSKGWVQHKYTETSTFGDLMDVWIVEAPGVIHLVIASRAGKLLVLKLERSNWALTPEAEHPAPAPLNGVFGVGKRAYAVGDLGTILACDLPGGDAQLTCDVVQSGVTEDLLAVWARGTAAPNLFVAGASATFLHCRPL